MVPFVRVQVLVGFLLALGKGIAQNPQMTQFHPTFQLLALYKGKNRHELLYFKATELLKLPANYN